MVIIFARMKFTGTGIAHVAPYWISPPHYDIKSMVLKEIIVSAPVFACYSRVRVWPRDLG